MLRCSKLAVLAVLALLPVSAFAAGLPGCDNASMALAAVMAPLNASPAGGAPLSPQYDPQNKACIYVCDWWGDVTSMHRGTGASCTEAHNALASAVGGEASSIGPGLCDNAGAALGYCGFILVVTVSCHWDFVLGTYVEDGYGKIKCKDYC
jgi:hypothetical protein